MEKIPTSMLVVAAALRREDGRWLMHQRPPHKHHGGLWEFPGGKVESQEFPTVALARELKEELGIETEPGGFAPLGFASQDKKVDEQHIVILLYTSRDWAGEPRSLEGGEARWFAFEEIANLPMPPLDQALLHQIAQKDTA